MLDVQFIREHLEEVKSNCRNRNVQADVDGVVQLDEERRRVLQETQTLQQRQNELRKLTPQEKDPAKKEGLIQEGRGLREQVTVLETLIKQIEAELRTTRQRRAARLGEVPQIPLRVILRLAWVELP